MFKQVETVNVDNELRQHRRSRDKKTASIEVGFVKKKIKKEDPNRNDALFTQKWLKKNHIKVEKVIIPEKPMDGYSKDMGTRIEVAKKNIKRNVSTFNMERGSISYEAPEICAI